MNRPYRLILLGLAALALHPAAGAAGPSSLLGLWHGVALIQPGEFEVEVEVHFSRKENGALEGRLSFTTNDDWNRPIHSLSSEGSRVRFAVTDDDGVVSSFDGWISQDGIWLNGDLEENGAHYLFKLRRRDGPKASRPQPMVRPLSQHGTELKELFNRDRLQVRLLLILSSSCSMCKSGAGIVQRYVLDEIQDPRLAVYVVWEGVVAHDTEDTAVAASRFLHDPRVVQFWTKDRVAGRAFEKAFGVNGAPVWDVYLLFPDEGKWEDAPPSPSFLMSNMPFAESPPRHPRLNGPELAAQIRSLLTRRQNVPAGKRSYGLP